MQGQTATAIASPNIAFVKYWGDRDRALHIPANGSISMNLDGLSTHTQVTFDASFRHDQLILDGKPVTGAPLQRVSEFLSVYAGWQAGIGMPVLFPRTISPPRPGSPLQPLPSRRWLWLPRLRWDCSSVSGNLFRLARLGSGSACRSVPGGFVEWQPGRDDFDFARVFYRTT